MKKEIEIVFIGLLEKVKESKTVKIVFFIAALCAIAGFIVSSKGCIRDDEHYTPKIVILENSFGWIPDEGGNRTGIIFKYANQSDAWAKKVLIDLVNPKEGYDEGKIKSLRGEKRDVEPKEIRPNSTENSEGWFMLEGFDQLEEYKNNRRKYRIIVFINWEDNKGKKYSLVVGYESQADNYKQVHFKKVYEYDTFTNKKKVAEKKEEYKKQLSEDMLSQ